MTVQQLLPTDLLTGLDSGSPVPLYHQIALRLEDAISRGVLQPGVRIESEVALAKRLNISRPTLSKAIGSLVSKGLLVRQKGVVSDTPVDHRQALAWIDWPCVDRYD